jgi:hypothetical protein
MYTDWLIYTWKILLNAFQGTKLSSSRHYSPSSVYKIAAIRHERMLSSLGM